MYIVIVGGGKVGGYLAGVLLKKGHEVAVIEADKVTADRLSVELEGQYLVIHGDGCDSDFQEDAGIRRADVFVAASGRDDDNLVACEIAKRVFGIQRCIARVNNPKNRRVFNKIGIECISSTLLIANMIEEETLLGGVGVVSSLARGEIALFGFTIKAEMKAVDPVEGIYASDIELPEGSMLIAVDRREFGEAEVITPDTVLYPGDEAIVVADHDVIEDVQDVFGSL